MSWMHLRVTVGVNINMPPGGGKGCLCVRLARGTYDHAGGSFGAADSGF